MTGIDHWHLIALQDHGTSREWWTIRTNPYDGGEAEKQARQLLTEQSDDQADGGDPWDETGGDRPDPAWSAVWLTSCTEPCTWAEPGPGCTWILPPPGQPWWHADGTSLPEPHRTGSVTLSTIRPATPADLALLTLTPAELAELAAALETSEVQSDA